MGEQLSVSDLRRKDTVLAHVLDSIFDGVYIADRERRILFWNKGAEELTGYAAEEVEGKLCRDNILNHIDEKGRLMCRGACPLTRTMASGECGSCKVYPLHKTRKRFPVQTHVAPIKNAQGEIIAAVEVFRDISQEENLRILQEKFNRLIAKYVSSATLDEVYTQLNVETSVTSRLRDLTVLYADVVGFTPYSEAHSAEETVSLLNDVFGICEVLTTEFHGDVDKFIGDCVMATFIDANDAVAAARRILAALKYMNGQRAEERQAPVALRIGINSGRVIQGDVGMKERKDLTVIGDVVNTAARLQKLAKPDAVYISEATFARLDDVSPFEFCDEAPVRGKQEPVKSIG